MNGYDLRDATHAQAKRELSKLCTYCSVSVFREKVMPPRLMKSSKEGKMKEGTPYVIKYYCSTVDASNISIVEQISVTLAKRPDKLLGIKIVGKK